MSETNGSYFFPFTSSVWLDNKDIFYTGLTEDWRIFYNILLLNGWRNKIKKRLHQFWFTGDAISESF